MEGNNRRNGRWGHREDIQNFGEENCSLKFVTEGRTRFWDLKVYLRPGVSTN